MPRRMRGGLRGPIRSSKDLAFAFRCRACQSLILFSANALSGKYTVMKDNPHPRQFTDLRIGFWYAFSH